MSEEISAPPVAPDPLSFSPDALKAAFADAKPVDFSAPAEPAAPVQPVAPVAPATPAAPEAPATNPVAPTEPVAPATPAAPAVDYAAYLREQFGVEQPDAIKTALEAAKEIETLRGNQRTPADLALAELVADPAKGAAYLKLQTTDFKTLPAKELLAIAYAHEHPELPAELAAIEAELEYDAKYAAAEFEDADDPQAKAAKLRLDYAKNSALTKMEQAKEAARTAVLSTTPQAEQPDAEAAARSGHWVQGVEAITAAPATEIAYTVDGQEVKLAFDNKSDAFKQAALDPVKWLTDQIRPTGKYQETDYDRLAEIVALLTQPDTLVKNAYAAGKASLGAVIPLDKQVNPAPAAPQSPVTAIDPVAALRNAQPRSGSTGGYNTY